MTLAATSGSKALSAAGVLPPVPVPARLASPASSKASSPFTPPSKRRRISVQEQLPRPASRFVGNKLYSVNSLPNVDPELLPLLCKFMFSQFDTFLEVVVCGLVYYEVILRKNPAFRRSSSRASGRKLLVAFLIGSKWVDDDCLENKYWSEEFDIPLKTLNNLERRVLSLMDFDASVGAEDYEAAKLYLLPLLTAAVDAATRTSRGICQSQRNC